MFGVEWARDAADSTEALAIASKEKECVTEPHATSHRASFAYDDEVSAKR